MRYVIIVLISLVVAGCQITDKQAQTTLMLDISDKPRQFILLGAGKYEGEFTVALFEEGFKVKPIAVTQLVTELESPTKIVEYRQAGYRYALKLSISHRAAVCVFSDGRIIDVSMLVIDIGTNETLAIIRQSGPDRDCPPLTPVWQLLAEELSKVW